MGLRERQKSSRRRAILDAAANLFVERGYDAAKTEQIAEKAEISIGTLYNYFQSKGEILLSLVTEESERILAANDGFSTLPEGAPAEVLGHLLGDYFAPKNVFLNKDLWRRGISLSFSDPSAPAAIAFRDIDRKLCQQVITLVSLLKEQGALPATVDAAKLGALLFNNANMLFFEFNRADAMTLEQLQQNVIEMTTAAVDMISPK